MPITGHSCRNPKKALADIEIERIHQGTLHVLDQVGVVFASNLALRSLERRGCLVDGVSGRVRFPSQLVEECIEQCPTEFTIRGRHRDFDLEVGEGKLYFQSHPGLYIRDLDADERREASLSDIAPLTRLIDAMDEIHLAIMPTATISDKPPPVMIEWVTAELLRNTQKVTAAGVFHGCAKWVIEMARVTNQQVYGQINPVSPLHYPAEQIEGGLEYVRAGHPVCILPGPTLGANSPATLAGTLVLQNAEHLAGVVLVQANCPGAPVTLGSYPHIMDMRTGAPCIGAVEVGLLGAALAQISRRYGIPSHPEFPLSDSKALDEQAALEKAMTAVLVAEAGASLMTNGGALEAEKTWSPIQLVIDNEINGMLGRLLKGIEVTDRTLALDVIEKVGPSGNFLRTQHTQQTWRHEQYLPRIANRQSYEMWAAQGSKEITEIARERALEMVSTHRVPPLPEEQDRELHKIVRSAEKEKLG